VPSVLQVLQARRPTLVAEANLTSDWQIMFAHFSVELRMTSVNELLAHIRVDLLSVMRAMAQPSRKCWPNTSILLSGHQSTTESVEFKRHQELGSVGVQTGKLGSSVVGLYAVDTTRQKCT